jgi:hypothetical protein
LKKFWVNRHNFESFWLLDGVSDDAHPGIQAKKAGARSVQVFSHLTTFTQDTRGHALRNFLVVT